MGKLVDFESARTDKAHKRKEAKVRRIRESFRAARESWHGDSVTTTSLKKLLKRKKLNKPRP